MSRQFYVHLERQPVSNGGKTTTALNVTVDTVDVQPYTLAVYHVRARSKAEATGVVMEWLARGQPGAMTVTQIMSSMTPNSGSNNLIDPDTDRWIGPPQEVTTP